MKIYQFNCREGDGIDLRQANAILKHRPDLIIREAPGSENGPDLVFNSKSDIETQKSAVKKRNINLKKIAKKYAWVGSDIYVYKNLSSISDLGHKVRMYNVDAPSKLLRETIINKWNLMDKPRHRGSLLLWWVYIYLREKIMAKNTEPLLKDQNKKVLVFMQKFHWLNVRFLLSKPKKDEIWQYYFGKFKKIKQKNISEIIRSKNKVLYSYWKRYSDFLN